MLSDTAKIKTVIERNTKAVALRPSAGVGKCSTTASLVNGYRCEIREGPWMLVADLPASEGGENLGPSPGVLGRGALASCLAMGIVQHAAKADVVLDSLSVEVECDWDAAGYLGLNDTVPASYTAVRVIVSVESRASPDLVREVIATAERYSPYIDVFSNARQVALTVNVGSPTEG